MVDSSQGQQSLSAHNSRPKQPWNKMLKLLKITGNVWKQKNVPLKQVLEVRDQLLFFYAQVVHKYLKEMNKLR